jgi:hypothetical protein
VCRARERGHQKKRRDRTRPRGDPHYRRRRSISRFVEELEPGGGAAEAPPNHGAVRVPVDDVGERGADAATGGDGVGEGFCALDTASDAEEIDDTVDSARPEGAAAAIGGAGPRGKRSFSVPASRDQGWRRRRLGRR